MLLPGAAAWLHAQRQPPGLGEWRRAAPAELGMDETKLAAARDFALKGGGSGMVIHAGKLVYSWGDPKALYDLKSTTKSIGVTALGLALQDRKVRLEDPAAKHHPEFGVLPEANRNTGWLKEVRLLHLAAQTAGFDKKGDYQPLLFRPGAKWHYSDGGPNWLAECLTLVYGRDLQDLLFERVFTPLGIARTDLRWRDNAYRPKAINGIPRREFGSGIFANVDAMARIGYLYLRAGRIGNRQILPPGFIARVRQPYPGFERLAVHLPQQYPDASRHYGLLWWNNADGALEGVPRDAYWSWGLFDSHIIVVPSLDLVVARAGKSIRPTPPTHPSNLRPLLGPIVEALPAAARNMEPFYPPSPVIAGIDWAPRTTIRRTGEDCDLWPTTWARDGHLYTAVGDCWGVEPRRPEKLGLGFARISGPAEAFRVSNVISPSGENTGQGEKGKKASGMLMVDGVLYMWVRNAGNSQLAWSLDQARTWTWSDWRFTGRFGYAAFLNFGRDYSGARDGYVYIYASDEDSAYVPWNRLLLARVPKERLRERAAYEFFVSRGADGKPVWTKDFAARGAVLDNPRGLGYRFQASYNAGLKRYLINQITYNPDVNTRFQGGFVIYDAPEPWGPWSTAYFTRVWDVAPGENQHFPPKWMSADGRTMYLIFSGDDALSVRKATVRLRRK